METTLFKYLGEVKYIIKHFVSYDIENTNSNYFNKDGKT